MNKNDYDHRYRYHRLLRMQGPDIKRRSVHDWLPIVLGTVILLTALIINEVKF